MTDAYRPDEDTTPAAQPDPVGTPQPDPAPQADPTPSTEDRAREMGWVDEDTWSRGPKAHKPHRSAEEFLRIADESGPVARERQKRQRQEFEQRVERLERANAAATEQLRVQMQADFDRRLEEATLAGDTATVRQIVTDRDKTITPARQPDQPPPEVEAWVRDNQWFVTDKHLHAEAVAVEGRLAERHPAMSLTDRLAKTREEMAKRYPDEFGATGASDQPATTQLAGGVRMAPKANGLVAKLPPEARAMHAQLVARGSKQTIEQYAADYFDDAPVSMKA